MAQTRSKRTTREARKFLSSNGGDGGSSLATDAHFDPAFCYKMQEAAFLSAMTRHVFGGRKRDKEHDQAFRKRKDEDEGVEVGSNNRTPYEACENEGQLLLKGPTKPCVPLRVLDVESRVKVDALSGRIIYCIDPPEEDDAKDCVFIGNRGSALVDLTTGTVSSDAAAIFSARM